MRNHEDGNSKASSRWGVAGDRIYRETTWTCGCSVKEIFDGTLQKVLLTAMKSHSGKQWQVRPAVNG